MKSNLTRAILGCLILSIGTGSTGAADRERVEITGDYRYAARESEPVADAQALACHEAWRLAVANSSVYREETASIVDSALLQNLSYILATNHVEDRQVVEQTQRGRTMGCRVHGYLPAEESARVIRTQVAGSSSEQQNRALRIVSTKDEGAFLLIQFQALKRIDWLSTAYQGTLRESADIMVDFYNEAGILMKTDRHPARNTTMGQDVLNPGMSGFLHVPKPLNAKSYRVWLVK